MSEIYNIINDSRVSKMCIANIKYSDLDRFCIQSWRMYRRKNKAKLIQLGALSNVAIQKSEKSILSTTMDPEFI